MEWWRAACVDGFPYFVCAHGSRDVRCHVCGPVLMEKFNEEIQLRGLKDQISVVECSHVGDHKYAGNLIIYIVLDLMGKLWVTGMATLLRMMCLPCWTNILPRETLYKNFGGARDIKPHSVNSYKQQC
ncbi:hypothetical protein RJT34_04058 [Clitoria ternatea]|uniref:Uncharacterized protein n=1 Tax=Clitoria ternatea TaxID=43366 RepID=A0AAN9Q329_CLITE